MENSSSQENNLDQLKNTNILSTENDNNRIIEKQGRVKQESQQLIDKISEKYEGVGQIVGNREKRILIFNTPLVENTVTRSVNGSKEYPTVRSTYVCITSDGFKGIQFDDYSIPGLWDSSQNAYFESGISNFKNMLSEKRKLSDSNGESWDKISGYNPETNKIIISDRNTYLGAFKVESRTEEGVASNLVELNEEQIKKCFENSKENAGLIVKLPNENQLDQKLSVLSSIGNEL